MSILRTVSTLSLLGSSALLLSACGAKAAPDARLQPPLVRIATVGSAEPRQDSFTGIVSARVQSDLGFRVPGKVIERLVDTGQRVKRNQPLMRIDRTDYALAIAAQTAAVDAARARAVQTSADEARYRDLVAAGAISAITYDQSKAAADAAKATLAAAQAQARVAEDEAGYALLVADADGIVLQTLAEPGQVVSAGQVVVRLAHEGPREATVNLPETVRPALGSTARATLFGRSADMTATLRQLSHAADPLTRTFDARYVLGDSAGAVPLGATVTIHVPRTDAAAAALEIPLSALFDNGSRPGVWKLDRTTSTLSWVAVTLSGLGEESAFITGGLKPGDSFVALGAHQLHQGEKIRTDVLLGSVR
jgi:RND family efflux transporter MFP subunit